MNTVLFLCTGNYYRSRFVLRGLRLSDEKTGNQGLARATTDK